MFLSYYNYIFFSAIAICYLLAIPLITVLFDNLAEKNHNVFLIKMSFDGKLENFYENLCVSLVLWNFSIKEQTP